MYLSSTGSMHSAYKVSVRSRGKLTVMPQPPSHITMARWPKAPVELERFVGAEAVRPIRESCVCVVVEAPRAHTKVTLE